MSVIATALKHLLAAGLTGDALVEAIADIEAAQPGDRAAEKRRAYDRERKAKAKAKKDARSTGIPPESAESAELLPPNDIYSNPPENPVVAKATTSPFGEKVVEAWNVGPAANGAQRANGLTPKRRKHLAARVREIGEEALLAAIAAIGRSDFHCGKGGSNFRADLGWFLESAERPAKWAERAAEPSSHAAAAPVADTGAYLASIADKPWMRGRENELAQPRNADIRNGTGPPRSFGQFAAGIASNAAH